MFNSSINFIISGLYFVFYLFSLFINMFVDAFPGTMLFIEDVTSQQDIKSTQAKITGTAQTLAGNVCLYKDCLQDNLQYLENVTKNVMTIAKKEKVSTTANHIRDALGNFPIPLSVTSKTTFTPAEEEIFDMAIKKEDK